MNLYAALHLHLHLHWDFEVFFVNSHSNKSKLFFHLHIHTVNKLLFLSICIYISIKSMALNCTPYNQSSLKQRKIRIAKLFTKHRDHTSIYWFAQKISFSKISHLLKKKDNYKNGLSITAVYLFGYEIWNHA